MTETLTDPAKNRVVPSTVIVTVWEEFVGVPASATKLNV
jgi:hypothetical protein